jgi:hypothetical protein
MVHQQAFCGAIVGRRKAGKTHLALQMLRSKMFKKYNFDFIMMFTPTMHLQKEVWKMITPKGILLVKSLNQRLIKKLLRYQSKNLKERGHVLIITDDLGLDPRRAGDKTGGSALDLLAFTGRHYDISTIQLAQKWSQITPSYRSQLDWFFWAGSSSKREVTQIHMEYGDRQIEVFREMVSENFNQLYQWLYFININGKMRITKL